MFASAAMGQGVLAPPPEFTEPLTAPLPGRMMGSNRLGTAAPGTVITAPLATPPWLDWGPVKLYPHLLERLLYGNGIQAQPGQQSTTATEQFSPGLFATMGNHWNLDLTPTLRFYSSRAFRNTTDYSVRLSGGTTYEDWTLGLSQSYVTSSEPLVETGSQTDTETYSTGLNATWHISPKTSLELDANQNFRFIGQSAPGQLLSDARSWSSLDWLNYQFWPKFSAAIGLGAGYDAITGGTDMTSEQVQGRVNWLLGQKLTLTASGGFEDRQFLNSSEPASVSPVFAVTLLYRLFETTSFSLNAHGTVSPSYFNNQITDTTGFTAGVRQRLFQKLFLDVSGSYSAASYSATTALVSANSENDYTSVTVRLSCPFLKRGSASVFYDWSQNATAQTGYGYTSHQTGLELSYRF